jgi:hypothetical protein
MADDPLAPSSAPPYPDSLIRLPVGQLGLDPYSALYAGLSPEQLQAYNFPTDPIFQYTFGPEGPVPGSANPYPGLFPPSVPDPFTELGPEQGAPSNFGARLSPETGNVEWGEPVDDPLMAQLQSNLTAQSRGSAPSLANMPTTARRNRVVCSRRQASAISAAFQIPDIRPVGS